MRLRFCICFLLMLFSVSPVFADDVSPMDRLLSARCLRCSFVFVL